MKLALALQLLLLAYHQATTLFDFYPFNGARFSARQERLAEAGFNFVMMVLAPIGFLGGFAGLMKFGAAYYPILFACELATWFVPYFFGASAKWQEIFSRVQGQTIIVIPRRGNNPTPNLEHLILIALTWCTALATLSAFRSRPEASSQGWPWALGVGIVMVGAVAKTHWKFRQPRTENRSPP